MADLLKYSTKTLLKRFYKTYLPPYIPRLMVAVMCMVFVALITAVQVQAIEPMVNDVLNGAKTHIVYLIAIGLVIIGFLKSACVYIERVFMCRIVLSVTKDLQVQIYEKLMGVDTEYLEREGTARQLSRFSTDIGNMGGLISSLVTGVIRESITFVALLGVMLYNSWHMTVFVMLVLPLTLIPIAKIGRKLERISLESFEEIGHMTAYLDDTLKGARQVKSYNLHTHVVTLVKHTFQRVFDISYRGERTASIANPILEVTVALVIGVILVWGAYLVNNQQLDAGRFMAFFVAMGVAYRPLKALSNLNMVLRNGMASCKRVFSLLDMSNNIQQKPDAIDFKLTKGTLEFKNIDFKYQNNIPVLHNVSLCIPAGKTVALVGASGSGKSTMLNLIPRFYDVNHGDITLDGTSIYDMTFYSLRQHISLVSQETILFNTTVRQNVALGDLNADENAIINALKNASAWEFVQELEHGLDSMVGERGLQLSGGQRQRISIARAFLKNAPIVLLDEATSALDTNSEKYIQNALDNLMKDKTCVVVAHRLSTIQDADIIYVMDRGQIVEHGTHTTLKKANGVYANLIQAQQL